jgi:hypothetical protein
MRRMLMKETSDMIKELEKYKVFSLLVNMHDKKNRSSKAVLPYSLFINKGTDVLLLTNLLIQYLVIHIQKYNYDGEIKLMVYKKRYF